MAKPASGYYARIQQGAYRNAEIAPALQQKIASIYYAGGLPPVTVQL